MGIKNYILDFTVKEAINIVKDFFGFSTKEAVKYIETCIESDPKQVDSILHGIVRYNELQSKAAFYND